MIHWLSAQPTEFRHLEEPHEYLAYSRWDGKSKEGLLCALLAIRVDGSSHLGAIHIHPIRAAWSHNTLKGMKADWPEVLEIFKSMGCEKVIASNPPTVKHFSWWKRFIRHFGFNQPRPVYVSMLEV